MLQCFSLPPLPLALVFIFVVFGVIYLEVFSLNFQFQIDGCWGRGLGLVGGACGWVAGRAG